jgi:predicted dehydrogenase
MHDWRPRSPHGSVAVGVIGAGTITRTLHVPVLLALSEARIAWVADRDVGAARSVVEAFGLGAEAIVAHPDALPDCDAVLLATPVGAREAYHLALASRKIAVLSEKPFAIRRGDHQRWAALYPEDRLGCGFMRRTYDAIRLLRQTAASGIFGAVRGIVVHEGGRTSRTGIDRPFLDDGAAAGGGVLLDYGSHAIDAAIHIAGASAFEIVEADLVWDGPIDRDASARVRLATPTGQVDLDFRVSWLERQPNTIEVVFDRGTLRAGLGPDGDVDIVTSEGSVGRLQPNSVGVRTSYQAFFAEWRLFLNGMADRRPSLVSAASALLTTSLVEAIYARGARVAR